MGMFISGSSTSTGSFGHTLSPTAVFSDRIAIGQTSLDSTYELIIKIEDTILVSCVSIQF